MKVSVMSRSGREVVKGGIELKDSAAAPRGAPLMLPLLPRRLPRLPPLHPATTHAAAPQIRFVARARAGL
ncbi:hypothetical protein ZWY2020_037793 [Hordeum vulgare]|nr:hypothetical protein ZWY2020_037793 [Hordeum vulgare]